MKIEDSSLENAFFDICKKNNIYTFIDIGSNRPENARRFLLETQLSYSSSPLATTFSFEANPFCFSFFFPRYQDSNLYFINLALGDRDGFIEFSIPKIHYGLELSRQNNILRKLDLYVFPKYHHALSKYHLVTNQGGSSVRNFEENINIRVPIMRFDSLGIGFQQSAVIWIDVEGSAMEVLAGFGDLLASKHIKAIYIEAEVPVNSFDHWVKLDSYKCLIANGFEMVAFSELNNAIFVRNPLIMDIKPYFSNSPTTRKVKKRRTLMLRVISWFCNIENYLLKW